MAGSLSQAYVDGGQDAVIDRRCWCVGGYVLCEEHTNVDGKKFYPSDGTLY